MIRTLVSQLRPPDLATKTLAGIRRQRSKGKMWLVEVFTLSLVEIKSLFTPSESEDESEKIKEQTKRSKMKPKKKIFAFSFAFAQSELTFKLLSSSTVGAGDEGSVLD